MFFFCANCSLLLYFIHASVHLIYSEFVVLIAVVAVYIKKNERKELPNTKLHTLLLDHHNVKLTWFIDWPKKEVLFNVDDAFTDDTDWFSFGFSQRGQIEGSDVCFFVRNIYDESYNEAIVSLADLFEVNVLSAPLSFFLCFVLFCFVGDVIADSRLLVSVQILLPVFYRLRCFFSFVFFLSISNVFANLLYNDLYELPNRS